MFGITMDRIRQGLEHEPSARLLAFTLRKIATPVVRAANEIVERATTGAVVGAMRLASTVGSVAALMPALGDAAAPQGTRRDKLRQGLNLALSVAQFASSAIIFSPRFGIAEEVFYSGDRDPLIVPADYTFSIWGFIFPASIAYGIYQAFPRQRTNALLRRIGFPTAFAFGCITLWPIAVVVERIYSPLLLFFGALVGLVYAVYRTATHERALTRGERLLVAVPLGAYAAWSTIGTVANTATSLWALGITDPFFREQTWAVGMLVVAGLISSFMTLVSRGNIAYASGIIWGLVGIVVATRTERPNTAVARTAGAMIGLVALALLRVRFAAQPRLPQA